MIWSVLSKSTDKVEFYDVYIWVSYTDLRLHVLEPQYT